MSDLRSLSPSLLNWFVICSFLIQESFHSLFPGLRNCDRSPSRTTSPAIEDPHRSFLDARLCFLCFHFFIARCQSVAVGLFSRIIAIPTDIRLRLGFFPVCVLPVPFSLITLSSLCSSCRFEIGNGSVCLRTVPDTRPSSVMFNERPPVVLLRWSPPHQQT
jgi:hypothetical protein